MFQSETTCRDFIENLQIINKIIQKQVDKEIAKSGLTKPQLMVLHELIEHNGITLKELSQQVGLSHSTVSGIIDRLEKKELVERQTDPTDRRYTRILITEQVKAYIEQLIPQYYIPIIEHLKSAMSVEQEIIFRGIACLRQLLEKT